jgi:hypothetical protein
MEKLIMAVVLILTMTGLAGISYAVEMPDMSIGMTGLYTLDSGRIVTGERVAVTLVTMFDGVLKGNIAAVFPNSNEYITSQFVGGPDLTINLFKLISGVPKLTITKDFKLEAGAGVMGDILNINGLSIKDIKKRVFPSAMIGFAY